MDKQSLREEFLNRRNNLNSILDKSKKIQSKLINLDLFKKCEFVFTYVNTGSEVITTDIINECLIQNKKVAVPKVLNKQKMIFVQIKSLDELVESKFGILEPISSNEILSNYKTIFLVPALVFDFQNYRIGYGGGYYDRYLLNAKCLAKIGLGYDFQLVAKVPVTENDIPLDFIITD